MVDPIDPSEEVSDLPDPKGAGSVSLGPRGVGSISPGPKGIGSTTPDPLGASSVLPGALGCGLYLARSLGCGLCLARSREAHPASDGSTGPKGAHVVSNHCGWHGPRTTLLTSGRERARLDMTHGHGGPYLGAHVCNNDRWTSVVLPNPRTAPIKGVC
jgi:hypothetical protein